MNRKLVFFVLAFLLVSGLLGCSDDKCFHATGDYYIENRPLTDSVNRVVVDGEFDIYLTSGSKSSLTLKAGRSVLPFIESSINQGVLKITDANQCEFFRDMGAPLEIYLTLPDLHELEFSSSGKVMSKGVLTWDTLRLNCLNGAGLIDVSYKSKVTSVQVHSGAEEVRLHGSSNQLYCYVVGYGPLDAALAPAGYVHVVHLGSNKAKVAVTSNGLLIADIRYTGDVFYQGTPSEINLIKSGSGELIKLK